MTQAYETRCPFCGHKCDCTSALVKLGEFRKGMPEPIPRDGSLSLCAYCGGLGVFSYMTPGGLRKPQPEEIPDIEADPMVKKIRRAMSDAPPGSSWRTAR